MTSRILFVCLGNICRSPAAEGMARRRMPQYDWDSAGTSDWHVGDAPYAPMQRAASVRGYDLSALRARQVSAQDFDRFDLILAMDADNLSRLQALRPSDATTPVRLLTDFDEEIEGLPVPDPYYTRDFDGAIDLIERALIALQQALSDRRAP